MAGSRNNTHINCNQVAGKAAYNIWKNNCDPCEECVEQIPNIRHWYRYNHGYQKSNGTFYDQADILTNIGDGGNIKGWKDQITGTNNLIATVSNDQPKYEQDDKSLYFKSGVKYLDFTSAVAFTQNSDWTLAIRYKHQLNTAINGSGITLFSGLNDLFSWKSTTSFEIQLNGGTVHTITGGALDPNLEHNFVFKREANVIELWIHGVLWGTSTPVDNGPMDLTHVGSQDPESENLKGYVTHISMYDRALDAHEIYCLEEVVERVYAENHGTCSDNQYTNGPDCESNGEVWTATLACVEPEIRIDTSCVTCYNGQDGTLTANLVGGTGPYTYAWTGPNGYTSTTNPMTGAASGVYTVTVTDTGDGNATYTLSATICNPPELLCTVTAVDVTIAGGSVTVVATGGTPGYTYQWATGGSLISGATNATYNTNTPGVYTVTVTDVNGCTTTCQGTILNAMDPLSIQCSAIDVDCDGDTDGGIDIWIDPTTVTYPISVQLDTGSYGGTAVSTTAVSTAPTNPLDTVQLSSLGANTYYITVTDSSSTPQVAQCTTTITAPPALAATVTATNATDCSEGCDGGVTIAITGGTSSCSNGYKVSIIENTGGTTITTQSLGVNTGTFSYNQPFPWGLCADTYTYIIEDCNECVLTGTFVIECPIPGDLTITTTDAPCVQPIGSTGSATFTVSNNGATALSNYQVTVSSSASTTYTHNFGTTHPYTDSTIVPGTTYTAVFEALVSGTWVFLSTQTFTVGTDPAISLSAAITHVTCLGGSDGAIDLSVTNGTSSFTYAWTGPNGYTASTEDITGLAHGDYQVTVTDSNGCWESEIYTVDDGVSCTCNVYGTDITCNGLTDGTAHAYINGCDCQCAGNCTYAWTGPGGFTSSSSSMLTGLAAGTYNLTVTGCNGCTSTCSYTVVEPAAITTSLTLTSQPQCGACDGQIDMSAIAGGTPGYSMAWNVTIGGVTTSITATSGPGTYLSSNGMTLYNVCAGSYSVTITDSYECEEIFNLNVTSTASTLSMATVVIPINECGPCCGHIHVTPSGGTGPYTYLWAPAPGSWNGAITQDINCTGDPGPYTITLTDADGCSITNTYTMTTIPNTIAVTATYDPATGNLTATASGGTAPYQYQWSFNGSNFATGATVAAVGSGYYCVTISDANGCKATDCISVTERSGEDESWNCTSTGCQGLTNTTGTYTSLQDCLDNCEDITLDQKWICFEHACVQTATGQSGLVYYNTWQDCIDSDCQGSGRVECGECECPDCSSCPGCSCNEVTNVCEPDQADQSPCLDPGECTDAQHWDTGTCTCVCTEVEECEEGLTWNPVSCRCN